MTDLSNIIPPGMEGVWLISYSIKAHVSNRTTKDVVIGITPEKYHELRKSGIFHGLEMSVSQQSNGVHVSGSHGSDYHVGTNGEVTLHIRNLPRDWMLLPRLNTGELLAAWLKYARTLDKDEINKAGGVQIPAYLNNGISRFVPMRLD